MPRVKSTTLWDVQEWMYEKVLVNGECKKRKRLLRTIAWGVRYSLAKFLMDGARKDPLKRQGVYYKTAKHKTPEQINKERIQKFNIV